MFSLEPAEYARPFIRQLVAYYNEERGRAADDFRAVVIAQRYIGSDPVKYPALRDRTDEFRTMLQGFGNQGQITEVRHTGSELYEKFGFKPVGAQFAATFDILWIN